MAEEEPFIKVIVVGEQGVGKTCLLNQYCYSRFDNNSPPTIGCDFTTKLAHFNNQTMRLQLWDIAGQERFNSVSKLYVRGALGCLIVCDIEDEKSLNETLKWKKIIEENCDYVQDKPIPMILVQNKLDAIKYQGKSESWQTVQHLEQFQQQNKFNASFQVSAKDNTNLPQTFEKLLEIITKEGRIRTNVDPYKQTGVKLNNPNQAQQTQNKKNGCC